MRKIRLVGGPGDGHEFSTEDPATMTYNWTVIRPHVDWDNAQPLIQKIVRYSRKGIYSDGAEAWTPD